VSLINLLTLTVNVKTVAQNALPVKEKLTIAPNAKIIQFIPAMEDVKIHVLIINFKIKLSAIIVIRHAMDVRIVMIIIVLHAIVHIYFMTTNVMIDAQRLHFIMNVRNNVMHVANFAIIANLISLLKLNWIA
jgi:hypothetical protein